MTECETLDNMIAKWERDKLSREMESLAWRCMWLEIRVNRWRFRIPETREERQSHRRLRAELRHEAIMLRMDCDSFERRARPVLWEK
jgi:hypothetical protein